MAFNSSKLRGVFWAVSFLLFLGLGSLLLFREIFSSSNCRSDSGRVNFLILGKSGEGFAGADLTDTLIFASVSLNNPAVTLVSIPRDIWVPEIRAKINSAYYWGNKKPELGGGIPLAKLLVGKVLGQPVHYAAVVDFSGFKDIVDAVGGIVVEVERSFTDTKYPIAGREDDLCGGDKEFKCRFETVHFAAGKQIMDGETALKFVRSRNGDNGENTNFAREARQQKVISAIKDEILSFHNLVNPATDFKIYRVLKTSIETDIGVRAGIVLVQRSFLARSNIKSFVFPAEMLVNPPISSRYDKQYVFVPKIGDWSEIAFWVKELLN